MDSLWELPQQVTLGGKVYRFRADFRQILKILATLAQEELPLYLRWQLALGRFYHQPIPKPLQAAALEYLSDFITAGRPDTQAGKLLDWQLDADLIVSDVNRVAGCEIRALPFVHWWTFLSWFHGIGPGQLSTVVQIRQKLRKGQKLDSWEQELYRRDPDRVAMRPPLTPAQRREKEALQRRLGL